MVKVCITVELRCASLTYEEWSNETTVELSGIMDGRGFAMSMSCPGDRREELARALAAGGTLEVKVKEESDEGERRCGGDGGRQNEG